MERYRKYFLQHSLWLEDGFCSYYVQDSAWGRQEILDVEAVVFDWADDAERWLHQCADHDHSLTLNRLRAFLADHCRQYYHLHRMNDRQVLSAAAREMTRRTSPVVIEPRMGWAVLVDANTAQPVQPISVEPSPDMDGLLSDLRRELDFLVAERQKEYDAYEVRLSQMSEVEKAALYGKSGAGAFIENTVGSIWDIAKALPGFYPTYLKALWRVVSTPARMAAATARSITTGNLNPLQKEIDAIVNPMALTWEQAVRFKSILTILFSNPDTCHLLHGFSQRYWDATHPVERTKMAVNAASDILLTILLAIFTAGIGAAANAAAKSGRLIRVAKLLERVALTLKKISPRSRLTGKAKKTAEKLGIGKKARSKAKKGIPDVKKPKVVEKLDDATKKGYGGRGKKASTKKIANPSKLSEFEVQGLKAQRIHPGSNNKVAVIGRIMGNKDFPGVRDYSKALSSHGYDVEIFDDAFISNAAKREFAQLTAGGRRLTNQELLQTKMFTENKAWAKKLVNEGYTILDLGNPYPKHQGFSPFYAMEKKVIFSGGPK